MIQKFEAIDSSFLDSNCDIMVASIYDNLVNKCYVDSSSSSSSIVTLPSTCADSNGISTFSDHSILGEDDFQIPLCVDIETADSYNMKNTKLDHLIQMEKEYNEFRMFLVLLETNY